RALTEPRRAEVVALRDRYEQIWQDAITALDVDAPQVARLALLEMCSGVSRWYSPKGALSLDDLASRYAEMALGMLGARQ
ncbi:MAG TPA: TetR/AcrR family transcriptional regulator, partial [Lentzea sp.]